MANKLSVAFIGTGIMGAPIAGHILDAGYPVTVNNRTKSKAAALIERGAAWADTPANAVANADVVFTMVGYPSEVEELYLAGDGLLACTKPGAVLIDLTTSSPELARDIAEAAQVSGRMAFDCPVTGGEYRRHAYGYRGRYRERHRVGPRHPFYLCGNHLLLRRRRQGPGCQARQPGVAGRLHGRHGRRHGICRAERP